MKKYLISTLTAAAAMAVPAFATGDGSQGSPYSGEISGLDLSGFEAGSTVYINGITSGYLANADSGAMSIVANIDISGSGMTLTNANSGVVYTFSGAITGSGNWTFSYGTGTPTQHYIFTGSLAGYSGNFSMTAGSSSNSEGYLQFGNGGQAATNTAVSGTGSITTSSSGSGFAVIYNYGSLASGTEDAITISNSSITTEDLQFTGSVDYSVSSVLAGYNSNAKLTISNTGTTTFNGNVSGFGTITINSGSTLAVGSGATLDLSGTTVDLASAIQNSGTITMSDSTSFVIDSTVSHTGWSNGSATYTLITGSGTIEGYESISVSASNVYGATSSVSYDDGTLTITFTDNAEATGLHGSGGSGYAYYTTGTSEISISTNIFTGAGTTLYLASDTQSLGTASENVYWSGSVTAACDIVIGAAGIHLTNGTSSNVHTFSGKISGEGSWTVTGEGKDTSVDVTQHYVFTGDLSEWSGDFTITTTGNATASDNYVHFGNGVVAATNTAISGTGAIAIDFGTVTYNYSGYANGGSVLTVTNSSIESHTIEFAGSVNYDVSANLIGWDGTGAGRNGATYTVTDSTLTISTTGTVTVRGSVSGFDHIVVSEGSGLTVAAGASVTLKEGGDLTVNSGATLTLNTSIAATGATVEFAAGASLVLTDAFLASTINTLDTYDAVTIIAASVINYNGSELSEENIDEFASIVSTSDNYLLDNWSYSDGVLSASVTYLPEPSMFGLMFGLGAIGLVATRRRKRA